MYAVKYFLLGQGEIFASKSKLTGSIYGKKLRTRVLEHSPNFSHHLIN